MVLVSCLPLLQPPPSLCYHGTHLLVSTELELVLSQHLPQASSSESVQFISVTQSCPILCHPMDCSTPGFPVYHQLQSLLKLTSIESVMPSNHLLLCRPLFLPPSIFPTVRIFSKESVLRIRWPKYWSFSFSISASNEYSGIISFRMGWLDLLALQGTFKSLLQSHRLKSSILWR